MSMKKTFISYMFGSTFSWFDEYVKNVQKLGEFGWEWLVVTPNKVKVYGNVRTVPMTTDQFNDLVERKLGVRPNMHTTDSGVPSVHVTDFHVFSGVILEDYLIGSDFFGITNFDVVYGRLDHYLPDSYLEDCDVFADDVNIINGVFSLFRNTPEVVNLFRLIPNWQKIISQPPCQRCITGIGGHTLFGSDEYSMTDVMRENTTLRYKYPKYYPLHSYDRLYQHIPTPMLEIQDDGSLWERFHDASPPRNYVHFEHGYIAREIAYFHFIKTKKWPKIGKYHQPL